MQRIDTRPPCGSWSDTRSAQSYKPSGAVPTVGPARATYSEAMEFTTRSETMPYILAWLLGVPAFVLVLIWLFAH